MRYDCLNQLLQRSGSARRYFLSLPIELQMILHEHDRSIHTAEELHQRVYAAEMMNRQDSLGKWV